MTDLDLLFTSGLLLLLIVMALWLLRDTLKRRKGESAPPSTNQTNLRKPQ